MEGEGGVLTVPEPLTLLKKDMVAVLARSRQARRKEDGAPTRRVMECRRRRYRRGASANSGGEARGSCAAGYDTHRLGVGRMSRPASGGQRGEDVVWSGAVVTSPVARIGDRGRQGAGWGYERGGGALEAAVVGGRAGEAVGLLAGWEAVAALEEGRGGAWAKRSAAPTSGRGNVSD